MTMSRHAASLLVPSLVALGTLLFAAPAAAQYRCPPGYVRNRFGRCAPFRQAVCPPGQVLRGGRCVFVGGPRPAICPRGWFFFRGRCRPR